MDRLLIVLDAMLMTLVILLPSQLVEKVCTGRRSRTLARSMVVLVKVIFGGTLALLLVDYSVPIKPDLLTMAASGVVLGLVIRFGARITRKKDAG